MVRVGMRRAVSTAAVFAAIAALVGCGSAGKEAGGDGSGESSGGSGTTITVWDEFTGGEALAMKETIKKFEASSGIKVKERTIGNEDFFTALRTGLAGNSPPDVVQYEGYQQTRDFAKAGRLTDITDFWNTIKDQYALSASAERGCTYEGRIYCIPVDFVQLALYYNPTILKKHGIAPPKTWDDFLAAGDKLKAAGITPVSVGSKDGWPASHMYMGLSLQRCGAETVYSAIDGKGAKWTDSCFQQAAKDLADMSRRGFFPKGIQSDDYGAMTAQFLGGKSPFMFTGTWFVGSWLETPPKFKPGILNFPTIAGAPGSKDVVGGALTDIGVSKKAKHPKEALEFLKFLATKDIGVTWGNFSNVSMVKGAPEASKMPKFLKDTWAQTQQSSTVTWYDIELPPAVGEDVLYNGSTAVAAGKLDPVKFTEQLQEAAESSQSGSG